MSACNRLAAIVGNLLDHYDVALYSLLAPFIAPLFFYEHDPLTALILTYSLLPLGIITKPLGSLFFGWIGDRYGRRQALAYSLFGMACVTFSVGSIPIYQDIGIWAPILLAMGRMFQSFFAAGESTGGAIFILEHTKQSQRGLLSSFYDMSSIAGILIASGVVTYLSSIDYVEKTWRLLFWGGSCTAVLGLFLRLKASESYEFETAKTEKFFSVWQTIKKNKKPLFTIIIASGFTHITYSFAFTLMNGYIPFITNHTKAEVMKLNTWLLILDMCMLPCFGLLAKKFGKERIMLYGAIFCTLTAFPLFATLSNASLLQVVIVRVTILTMGVAFAATYHAWAMEEVPITSRYTILSMGSALGSQIIGAPTSAVSLWLYKTLNLTWAPSLYLMLGGLGASVVLYQSLSKKRNAELVEISKAI